MIQQLSIPHIRNGLCREDALMRLSLFGIKGKRVYLIDLIPLIEMIRAGGQLQPEKIDYLDHYTKQHLRHINQMAGYLLLSMADATQFTAPYLLAHPDMAHLKKIRECITPVRLGETRNDYGDLTMRRILSACLKLLSISLAQYPDDVHDEYCSEERGMYLDIMESFGMHGYEAKNPLGKGGKGEKTHEYYPVGFLNADGPCDHGCGVFFNH
jgi:hypothetical protein